jgi:methyl-accepting chemotaxis protein
MKLSSHRKIVLGFVLVMAAAAALAATALAWLWHIDQLLEIPRGETVVAVRASVRDGYWLITGVGAVGTLVSCGCIWWMWSTMGRVFHAVGLSLQQSSAHVLESVQVLAAHSQQLAGNSTRAAATIEETGRTIEQISNITGRNAGSAAKVKLLAGEARAAVTAGADEMRALALAMGEIEVSGSEVARITHDIDQIAFQTNLLALNAAIEAARAGDSGLGFGVVAREVHALARRSAAAAQEMSERIGTASEKNRHGVALAARASERLRHIVTCNQQLDTLAAEVAADSREQERGVGNLRTSCGQLQELIGGNAAAADSAASSTDALQDDALRLRDAVSTLQELVQGGAHPQTDQGADGVPRSKKIGPMGRIGPMLLKAEPRSR